MSVSNRITPNDVSSESKKKFEEEAEENKNLDFLGVDSIIPGQSWVCLSFVSPEEFIKQRHLFYFEMFMKSLSNKIDTPDNINAPKTKFEELFKGNVSYDSIKEAWEAFLEQNNEKLSQQFEEESGGRTSTRGLKIRGSYATYQEAKHRSDRLAELDKNHHVYIGQVGYWLPWDPNPSEVQEQEYQNKQLNNLMKKYEENISFRDRFYEERKQEKLREAMERNKKAKEDKPDEKKVDSMDLDKVREIVQEKNKTLQKSLDERKKGKVDDRKSEDKELLEKMAKKNSKTKKKPKKPKKNSDTEPVNESTEVNAVFNSPDPWMEYKKNQDNKDNQDKKEKPKKKRGRPKKN
jgi:hypothetical protein